MWMPILSLSHVQQEFALITIKQKMAFDDMFTEEDNLMDPILFSHMILEMTIANGFLHLLDYYH
jgi:hypothetical protein